jgi:hypothetical protein
MGVTEKREPDDGYLSALHDLIFEPSVSAEEKAQADRLYAERAALNDRTNRLIESYRSRIRVQVRAQHEAAKAAVVEQQQKPKEHHDAIAEMNRELARANEKKSIAFAARDSAQEARRTLTRYATKAEQEKANLLLAKREAEADVAAKEHGTLQQQINFATLTGLKPLMERLNELIAEEARLNHYVTGQSYTTELGIVTPPRPPL